MRTLRSRRLHPRTRAALVSLLLLVMLLALQACGGASDAEAAEGEAAGPPRFVVVNRSGEAIKDIAVKANLMIRFRDLSPGESSTMVDAKLRVPRQVSIRWTDSDGEHHYEKCDASGLGDSPSTCRFVIDDRHNAVLGP